MATWLLSTLLKKGIVDYVIAVVPNDDPDQLLNLPFFQIQNLFSILPDQHIIL